MIIYQISKKLLFACFKSIVHKGPQALNTETFTIDDLIKIFKYGHRF